MSNTLRRLHDDINPWELVKQRLNLEAVLSSFGWSGKKVGHEFAGDCPTGHDSRSHTCFSVDFSKGLWKCFNCGLGGDLFDLVEAVEGTDGQGALKALCQRFSLPEVEEVLKEWETNKNHKRGTRGRHHSGNAPRNTAERPLRAYPPDPPKQVNPALWQQKALALVTWAEERLWEPGGSEALAYLRARGLTDETIRRFRLGYTGPEDIYRTRESWGLRQELNDKGNPCKVKVYGRSITIPVPDPSGNGNLVRVKFRQCRKDIDKRDRYRAIYGSDNKAPLLLGADNPVLFVVEGELDGFLLSQEFRGLPTGVMALGTVDNDPEGRIEWLLSRRVYLAIDYDDAGFKHLAWWRQHLPGVRRVPSPEGKDWGEAHVAGIDLRDLATRLIQRFDGDILNRAVDGAGQPGPTASSPAVLRTSPEVPSPAAVPDPQPRTMKLKIKAKGLVDLFSLDSFSPALSEASSGSIVEDLPAAEIGDISVEFSSAGLNAPDLIAPPADEPPLSQIYWDAGFRGVGYQQALVFEAAHPGQCMSIEYDDWGLPIRGSPSSATATPMR